MSERIDAFISDIMTAIANCTLFSSEHPAVLHLAGKAVRGLESLFSEDVFNIALLGDSLVVNEQPFASRSLQVSNFKRRLRRKGIDKIVISRGVTAAELRDYLAEIALSGRILNDYPHIISGIIEVRLGGGGTDVAAVMDENIEKVKEVYKGVSRFKRLDMVGMEDVVASFISTVRQEANILKVICPVKAYSEYTYTHNTNVSILSIFQAEGLGVKNELLHDIGLAGLLHDVGKIFVSKEVLEKESKLNEHEWGEMKKHPAYGAMYLATLPEIPKCSLLAAYEHHMNFNGGGYPETKRRGRRQHIISQIIAIADFFDALRSDRPYRKSLEVPVIFGLMMESPGKYFNPVLVEHFIRSFNQATNVAA